MDIHRRKQQVMAELQRIAGLKLPHTEIVAKAEAVRDAFRAEVEAENARRRRIKHERESLRPLSGFRPIGYQYHLDAQLHFRRRKRKHARMLRAAGGFTHFELLVLCLLILVVFFLLTQTIILNK